MTIYINRRNFVVATAALAATPTVLSSNAFGMDPTTHEVQMLNVAPDNPRARNVFEPRLLVINPGDTVNFASIDRSHNSQSTDGMIPEGAEPWRGGISQSIEVTFEVPGFYGYQCTPHVGLGMVGLVVVDGEGKMDNLEAARAVRQRGRAMQVWEEIWAEAEEQGLLA